MYKFLKDWPKDREMGWSEELCGVCHMVIPFSSPKGKKWPKVRPFWVG